MSTTEIKIGAKYRHFKGMEYLILNVAKHSETLEDYVVYEALYENKHGKIWIRPLNMFTETVTRDGKTFPRFQLIG